MDNIHHKIILTVFDHMVSTREILSANLKTFHGPSLFLKWFHSPIKYHSEE